MTSFVNPPRSARCQRPLTRSIHRLDALESRLQFCVLHVAGDPPVELRPDLVQASVDANATTAARGGSAAGEGGEPADIVWINRANTTAGGTDDTDLFGSRFGASAPAARAVVDAVIVAFEKMIGSFNYAVADQTYSLTVKMLGVNSGFGASAGLATELAGKPQSGSINLGAGTGTSGGNGWFLDPTPDESSEFLGTTINAFAGNAPAGSPAAGKGDFYTIVALELTHCVGLFGDALPGWAELTNATTIADTAEGGGVGEFWTFNGPSIQHLLTGNNGGSQGQDFDQAIHSAGPISVNIDGTLYSGAQDQGNAIYEFGRRYLVSNVFALMFKDAYGYSTVDPARYGTFYSTLNSTTKAITVRGGATTSADNISITRSGNTLAVSVDVGNDIAGTGALPGPGNLPAFVSYYDVSEVVSIAIRAGDGVDSINIDDLPAAVMLTIDAGAGTDIINVLGTDPSARVTISASTGGDALNINADNIGSAAVVFATTQAIGSLTIGDGGLVTTADGSAVTITTGALDISAAGTFDLKDDSLIVDYTGASPVASIAADLRTGYAGGAWTGNGIVSSTAAATTGRAIGYGEARDLFATFPATFAGTTIDDTAIVLKFAVAADADLNGTVDFADLVRLSQNYNLAGQTFARGDFDYDGTVAFSDLVILSQQYGQTLTPAVAAITATPASTTLRKSRKIPARGIALL